MRELKNEAAELEAQLVAARELLAEAVERVGSLRARLVELDRVGAGDTGAALEAVERLTDDEQRTLDEARARGQGAGLRRAIDKAAALDEEQQRLVRELKAGAIGDPGRRRSVLERVRALEQEQRELLTTEVGKFEAQGLTGLLEQFRALGEQQDAIIERLLSS